MSNNNTEQAIVTAKANVMIYDDANKKWNPSGSSPGPAKVQIYQHLLNQTYRVVGRKIQDHEVVINCLLTKGLKYNQANQTFLQWRDSKVVYGLHFATKDEADIFTQTMKVAVDNLNRLAGISSSNSSTSSTSSSNTGNGMSNGDNISLGKRSISSDYNQSIYDETEIRPNYNMINTNGHGISHQHNNNSSNGVYNGMTAQNPNNNNNMRLSKQNSITSPPLSTSSSSSSSSSSTNGLSISISNQNGSNSNLNGNLIYPSNGINHTRQNSDHINNATNGHNGNNNNQFYLQQQQQQHQMQQLHSNPPQVPLYQSSPIPAPPPPPPPIGSLFANQNFINNQTNNNNNADNYSQKIYDVIPDTNTYMPSSNGQNHQSAPPPPPPLPSGFFNGSLAPPAPPPPPIMTQPSMSAVNSNNNNNSNGQSTTNGNSYLNEIGKFQANKLKKVEESSSNRSTAPPQLDFLTEIRQKLEKKNSLQNGSSSASSNNSDEQADSYKPSNFLRKQSTPGNSSSGNKLQQSGNSVNHIDSPKAIKKIISTPNVNNSTNGHVTNGQSSDLTNGTNGGASINNYEKLKQELILEFRKELQTFKADIISSILGELRIKS